MIGDVLALRGAGVSWVSVACARVIVRGVGACGEGWVRCRDRGLETELYSGGARREQ